MSGWRNYPPFAAPFQMDFPHTIGLALPSAPPPAPPLQVAQVALGLLIYIDAGSIYIYVIVMLAQLQSALYAQVAWLICIGLWLHLASVWQCPQLGNACAWQLSADYLDCHQHMHSSWPKIGHAAVASAFEPHWESTSALYIWPQSQPWPQARDPPAQHGVRVP